MQNLSLVSPLTADSAVELLRSRYAQHRPYTLAQDQVLIAINPLQDLGLNGRKSWIMHDTNSMLAEPHVYSISSCVQKRFALYDSQAVFCCGESGSGKTESAKLILEHFASSSSGEDNASNRIVMCSNPVLEAFGNAATQANANSSRFGKVLTLSFSNSGGDTYELNGCEVQTFLFERSRICSTNDMERNFHIFYQLLSNSEWAQEAGLGTSSNSKKYSILNRFNDNTVQRNDAEDFESTLAGLTAIGVSTQMQRRMMRVLASILHIGEFQGDFHALQHAAALLETSQLQTFFTKRSVTVRHETICMDNTLEQSIQLRDLLCKELYLVVFEHILRTINQSKAPRSEAVSSKTCYLVDIMGFECLHTGNAIEQLLINYANERIFDLFVSTQICSVEEEYVREGITFEPRNGAATASMLLGLFDSQSNGLWRLLESEGQTPGGSDGGFLRKLKSNFPSLVVLEKRSSSTKFTVEHFAGKVTYEASGFLERSQHKTSAQLVDLLQSSALVQDFASSRECEQVSSKKQRTTIGTVFQREMNDLVGKMGRVQKISWIRCIRPSNVNCTGEFDVAYVKQQLEQSGILAAIQISRSALPIRLPLGDFLLLSSYMKDDIDEVIDAGQEVKFGATLVYLTDALFQRMWQSKRQHFAVLKLQARVRLWIATRQIYAMHRAATRIKQWWIRRSSSSKAVEIAAPVVVVEEQEPIVVVQHKKSLVAQLVDHFEESGVVISSMPPPLTTPVPSYDDSWVTKQLELEERIAKLEAIVVEKDQALEEQKKRSSREQRDLTRRVQELQREVLRLRGNDDDDNEQENDQRRVNTPSRLPPPPKPAQQHRKQHKPAGILGLLMFPETTAGVKLGSHVKE